MLLAAKLPVSIKSFKNSREVNLDWRLNWEVQKRRRSEDDYLVCCGRRDRFLVLVRTRAQSFQVPRQDGILELSTLGSSDGGYEVHFGTLHFFSSSAIHFIFCLPPPAARCTSSSSVPVSTVCIRYKKGFWH